MGVSYKGIQRIETLEYPRKTLREAILNAIVHSDYSGTYTNCESKLQVKNESLSIWNSGNLPEQLSIELLKQQHASIHRNRTLANLFLEQAILKFGAEGYL